MREKRRIVKKVASIVFSAVMTVTIIPTMPATETKAAEAGFDIGVVNFDATLTGANQEKENLVKMKKYIKDAKNDGDEILVFPEYTLTSDKENAINVNNSKAVTSVSTLAESNDMYILFGSMIKEDGKYYSATVICKPDGTVDTYEKTHLTDEEYKEGLSVGDDPYVLTTEYGKFGLALGQEFAEVAELGKYYYGSSVRMVLVSQAYAYETGNDTSLTQGEYDMYTATYAYLRMYSRAVAVANLYTTEGTNTYFGESHVCTNISNGWIAGCGDGVKPVATTKPGVESGSVAENTRDTSNGMSSRRLNQLADWYGKLVDYKMPTYGKGSKYKDTAKVASVNFHPVWGDLDTNVALIEKIMKQAHEEGIKLLAFPEMALTGYDVIKPEDYDDELKAKFGDKYMQHVLAQVVRGDNPSAIIKEIQKKAEEYGMYVVIGLPEQDEKDVNTYWNSVAILGPNTIKSYRKVNLAFPEPNWASYGTDNDGIFETPFGYVGVAICADIYNYQELQRTYSEMGCRIVINCTAGAASNNCSDGSWQLTYQNRLESFMLRDDSCMITSNLVGYEGPITSSVTKLLADNGYTVDDLDTWWFADKDKKELFNTIASMYGPSRSYIFPGASVCIGLDKTSATGTKVFGNTATSNVTSLGEANPYINLTPDTFNKYYGGELDLSQATLHNFYSENPYDYRPELYYKWYTKLFYDTYNTSDTLGMKDQLNVGKYTYKDSKTGVEISGDSVLDKAKFTVIEETGNVGTYNLSEYNIAGSKAYDISSDTTITTSYTKTGIYAEKEYSNKTIDTVAGTYTSSYLPYFGSITVTIPTSLKGDMVKAYTSDGTETVDVKDGKATVSMTKDGTVTLVAYNKKVPAKVTPTESTTKVTLKKTKVKSAVRTSKKIKISLLAVKKAKGYEIKYSTSKKFKKNVTVTKKFKKTKFTLTKIKKNKKYYVKARAYAVVNKNTVYGKWSNVKTVSVK